MTDTVHHDTTLKEIYTLRDDNELRLGVSPNSHVAIEVTEGSCEIFGAELQARKVYSLGPGSKVAIYTFSGAKVRVIGKCEFQYFSNKTPMQAYFKFMLALEQSRIKIVKQLSQF